eukprot:1658445-Pleurochrysis_carterae.AAC.1
MPLACACACACACALACGFQGASACAAGRRRDARASASRIVRSCFDPTLSCAATQRSASSHAISTAPPCAVDQLSTAGPVDLGG